MHGAGRSPVSCKIDRQFGRAYLCKHGSKGKDWLGSEIVGLKVALEAQRGGGGGCKKMGRVMNR